MRADLAGAPPSSRLRYDAIVVGGSSGGIDALVRLLPSLPGTLQAALLVVLHLQRDRRSLLVDIFQGRCDLALQEAQDQMAIAPGTVYFAPPDYHLLVDAGPRTALSVDPPVNYSRPCIDVLFETAADHYRDRLIGILLSGANDDGARGMQAIADAGGLVIVQSPADAAVPVMPMAALARTAVPHVLPVEGIAVLLTDLHRQGQL